MRSSRSVLNELERRTRPHTSYPLASSSSARYDPSCPVIPVISARFIDSLSPFDVLRSIGPWRRGRDRKASGPRTRTARARVTRRGGGATVRYFEEHQK